MADLEDTNQSSWYLSFGGQVYGPFTRNQMVQLIIARRVNRQCMVREVQEAVWVPIQNVLEQLATDQGAQKAIQPFASERRVAAPRVDTSGTIKVGDQLWQAGNISTTGLFAVTNSTGFEIGDVTDLEISLQKLYNRDPINVTAEVVRYSANMERGVGYGLQFRNLSNDDLVAISKLVGVRSAGDFGEIFSQIHDVPPPPQQKSQDKEEDDAAS
jgi:phage FluMu protein gp41